MPLVVKKSTSLRMSAHSSAPYQSPLISGCPVGEIRRSPALPYPPAVAIPQTAPGIGSGSGRKDYAGRQPLVGGDTDMLNEAFWGNTDSIIDKASDYGLYVMVFPLWGSDYAAFFDSDCRKAYRFGLWLV
jgi:hypothetical protein